MEQSPISKAKPRQEQELKDKKEEFNLPYLFHSQWLASGQDALVFRIDRSGQVRWSLSQVAGVPKAEEAVSPAEESIDLVGLEQTEVKSLVAPDEIGPGRGAKG